MANIIVAGTGVNKTLVDKVIMNNASVSYSTVTPLFSSSSWAPGFYKIRVYGTATYTGAGNNNLHVLIGPTQALSGNFDDIVLLPSFNGTNISFEMESNVFISGVANFTYTQSSTIYVSMAAGAATTVNITMELYRVQI